MHPPFQIDEACSATLQDAYRSEANPQWNETDAAEPLLAQVEPLLGKNSEPDPEFFVESWTIGVTAASENHTRREQDRRNHEPWSPTGLPGFSFVTFVNVEPPTPVAAPAPATAGEPTEDSSASRLQEQNQEREQDQARERVREQQIEPLAPMPVTLQTARHLLGVADTSTREQIKTAYRRMASRYHPDHAARSGTREQKLASDRMAAINQAYRLLCDARLDPFA